MSERITYVEIDLKRCSNTYGSTPCTAAGTSKCFNSYATCQDKPNFTEETVTARYGTVSGAVNPNIDFIPSIQGVSIRPALLELGESIGVRASGTVTFKDHRYPDTGAEGDRYLESRNYDPYTQGTYWGKFRARFPFIKGRAIRVLMGTIDDAIEQIAPRHFVVDRISGPDSNGTVTLTFKDALALADGEKAKAPLLSSGYLNTPITDTDTSLTLAPGGIGSDYPASGFVAIGGKEIVSYTRSGNTLNITRAQLNTEAVEHDSDDAVQVVLTYTAQKVTAIIYDLLINYASIPASYINFDVWTAEDDAYIRRLYSGHIPQPENVTTLVNELLQQTASTIWWDDSARLIRFRTLRDVSEGANKYDGDVIVEGSFNAADQPDKRVSQAWTYYSQINPLESVTERKNYSNGLVTTNSESEENYDGQPAIRETYSRWIPSGGRDAASRLNAFLLARYAIPPRLFSFNLQRNEALPQPLIGSGYLLSHWSLQDETGAETAVKVQTVQVDNTPTGHKVKAEEVLYSETVAPDDPTIKNVFIEQNETDINLYNYLLLSQLAPISGDTVNFYIDEGYVVGATSTSNYAIDTGIFPDGVTVNLYIYGVVVGKGGAGGAGGDSRTTTSYNGANGGNGGNAILVRNDINIINDGLIAPGGGGGGGGGGANTGARANSGGGGGGAGFGYDPASGGLGGVAISFEAGRDGDTGTASSTNITRTQAPGGTGGKSYYVQAQDVFASEAWGGDGGSGSSIVSGAIVAAASGQNARVGSNKANGGAPGTSGVAITQTTGTATITGSGSIL